MVPVTGLIKLCFKLVLGPRWTKLRRPVLMPARKTQALASRPDIMKPRCNRGLTEHVNMQFLCFARYTGGSSETLSWKMLAFTCFVGSLLSWRLTVKHSGCENL